MNDIVYRTLLEIRKKLTVPGFFVRRMGSGMEILEKLLKGQERDVESPTSDFMI